MPPKYGAQVRRPAHQGNERSGDQPSSAPSLKELVRVQAGEPVVEDPCPAKHLFGEAVQGHLKVVVDAAVVRAVGDEEGDRLAVGMRAAEHEVLGPRILREKPPRRGKPVDETGGNEIHPAVHNTLADRPLGVFLRGMVGRLNAVALPVLLERDEAHLFDDVAVFVTRGEDVADVLVVNLQSEAAEHRVFSRVVLAEVCQCPPFQFAHVRVASQPLVRLRIGPVVGYPQGHLRLAQPAAVVFVGEADGVGHHPGTKALAARQTHDLHQVLPQGRLAAIQLDERLRLQTAQLNEQLREVFQGRMIVEPDALNGRDADRTAHVAAICHFDKDNRRRMVDPTGVAVQAAAGRLGRVIAPDVALVLPGRGVRAHQGLAPAAARALLDQEHFAVADFVPRRHTLTAVPTYCR